MLGEQIKLLRQANKMSQVELARILGVSKQSVSNWENNNILPSIYMLRAICKTFSCSADFILGLQADDSIYLDVSGLTKYQVAHISQIIKEYRCLNEKITAFEQAENKTDIKTTDDI